MSDVKTIELALQGGGAHGAISWGVLDRLLEEPQLRIEGISGTSAGAMNAIVVADGFQRDGANGARQALAGFWRAVSEAATASPVQRDLWSRLNGDWSLENSPMFLMFDLLTRVFSPYQFNPLDINPLRDLVLKTVDFERVRCCKAMKIFVTATNVHTGQPKIFRQPEITVDAIMASAAIPFIFKAVEIGTEAYWDGGYMGNPALFPLVDECVSRDLMLVQINPFYRPDIPVTARDIINRVNEITFNASLIKELRSILLLKQLINAEGLENERYRDMRLHRIDADEDLLGLEASSKLNAEWPYLTHLRDLGRSRAQQWLETHWDHLGKQSTFELDWLTHNSIKPVECEAVAAEAS